MDKIKSYIDHFFQREDKNQNYTLSIGDVSTFINEIQGADVNGLFCTILTLFNYGYVKGYRAALAKTRKKGGAI